MLAESLSEQLSEAEEHLAIFSAIAKVAVLSAIIREDLEITEEGWFSKPILNLYEDVMACLSKKSQTLGVAVTIHLISEKCGRVIEAMDRVKTLKGMLSAAATAEPTNASWVSRSQSIPLTHEASSSDSSTSEIVSTISDGSVKGPSQAVGNSATQKQYRNSKTESSANETGSFQVVGLDLPEAVIKLIKQSLHKIGRLLKQSSLEDRSNPDANLITQVTDDLVKSDRENPQTDDSKSVKAKHHEFTLNQIGPDRGHSSSQDTLSLKEEIEAQETQAAQVIALVSRREDWSLHFARDLLSLDDASYKIIGDVTV